MALFDYQLVPKHLLESGESESIEKAIKVDAEALEEKKFKQPKPFDTTLRTMTKGPIAISAVVAAILTGSFAPFNSGVIGMLVGDVVVDVIEAIRYNKVVKKYDNVKQIIAKSYSLRRDIFKLIDKIGVKGAAQVLENFEQWLIENPDVLANATDDTDFKVNFTFDESLTEDVSSLNMSMEDFLKALSDMRAEHGDGHEVDVDEINAFMVDWKEEQNN